MHTTDDFATEARRRGLDDFQNPSAVRPFLTMIVIVAGVGALVLVVILGIAPDRDPVADAKPAAATVIPCTEAR